MTTNTLLNRYEIIEKLGSGGFGETFLAKDTQVHWRGKCVIKQLKPIDDPDTHKLVQQRFEQEAKTLEQLGAKNDQIPKLYDYFCENGQFYLVQEWVEGQTLTKKVEQAGSLPENTVKEILENILPVLDDIHGKGIIHRDIKPDNIIVRNSDGKPVLIDFGAVKESTTGGNTIRIGTPGYMPDEQSNGKPVLSSDLYSLGVTAVYLLTGRMPQTDHTGELIWDRNVSPKLAAIIDKVTQPHPRDRYFTAKEMLKALNSVSQTEASRNPSGGSSQPDTQRISPYQPPPYPSQVPQDRGLSDWQKALIMGGVIGIFVAGVLWLTRPKSSEPIVATPTSTPTPPTPTPPTPTPPTPTPPTPTPPTPTPPTPTPPTPILPTPTPPTPILPTPTPPTPILPTPTPPVQLISQTQAKALIGSWMLAKKALFGPQYDRRFASALTTGKAYSDNVRGPNSKGESESSSEWLQNRGHYYLYSVQRIDKVQRFESGGNAAVIEVVITEGRTLYTKSGKIDKDNSGLDKSLVRYSLQLENGTWKIADYQIIN